MRSNLNICQLGVVLCVVLSTVTCDTFYIVPSSSSLCPGEFTGIACLTLPQYASNPSQSQNIFLLVEPGAYDLSVVLSFSSDYFSMLSTNATVICTSTAARFEFNSVENVHISGITFQGCRNAAIYMSRVASASIVNSNFTDNEAVAGTTRHGGALYATFSSITISECEFRNNTAHSTGGAVSGPSANIFVENSIFVNNTARSGGAIYCSQANSQIVNTTFIRNSLRDGHGGAISIESSANSSVSQCQFVDNTAMLFGGAIFTSSSSLLLQLSHWQLPGLLLPLSHCRLQRVRLLPLSH